MGIHRGLNVINDGLVFGYDTGYGVADNSTDTRFYKGKPITNTWNKNTHSHTSGNITATRNATPPVPPPLEVQGFEVYKLQSNDGALNQGIMGTSNVVDGVGGAYVHSVYCYLESGTTVTVGQHWNPWAYGSSQTPPIGEWVRLSETVTNAVDNYGNIANAYRTNGVAYFTAPQYELGSYVNPHVDGTRSSTNSLIDLKRTTDIDVSNVSFDSTGQPIFDGTNDKIVVTNKTSIDSYTYETVVKINNSDSSYSGFGSNFKSDASGYSGVGNGWVIRLDPNGSLQVYTKNNSTTLINPINISGFRAANVNKYIHLVYSYSNGSNKLYINGILQATGTGLSGTTPSDSTLIIGAYSWGISSQTYYINASQPIVKLYNKTLTASEIKQNYNAYKNRFNI